MDELLVKLKQKTNQEDRVIILLELSNQYKNTQIHTAFDYALQAYKESSKSDLPKLSGAAASQIGLIYYLKNEIDSAIDLCGKIHHVRNAILKSFLDSEHARGEHQHRAMTSLTASYLRR
ncbi:MAG: hypothetical protein ACOVP1_08270, partial [Bacteroidia bacterium]